MSEHYWTNTFYLRSTLKINKKKIPFISQKSCQINAWLHTQGNTNIQNKPSINKNQFFWNFFIQIAQCQQLINRFWIFDYPQDFTRLKILAKDEDLNDFKDIGKIDNEFYFKKDEEEAKLKNEQLEKEKKEVEEEARREEEEDKNFENELEEIINHLNITKETKDISTNEMPPTSITDDKIIDYKINETNKFHVNISSEIIENDVIDKTVINIENDELDYDEDDEDDLELDENMKYSSIQRTALTNPLLHGFGMSPGYPKFYIGESECRWTISAPKEQKIRLTFLDISLRCKFSYSCKFIFYNRLFYNFFL